MPGLVPGIHVFVMWQGVDGRDKPGHDVVSHGALASALRSAPINL